MQRDASFVDYRDALQSIDSNFTINARDGDVYTNRQLLRLHSGYFARCLSMGRKIIRADFNDYDSETVNLLINYMMFAGSCNMYPVVRYAQNRCVSIISLLECASYFETPSIVECIDAELSIEKPDYMITFAEIAPTCNMPRIVDAIADLPTLAQVLLSERQLSHEIVKIYVGKMYREYDSDSRVVLQVDFVDKWISLDVAARSHSVEEFIDVIAVDVKNSIHRDSIFILIVKYAGDAVMRCFANQHYTKRCNINVSLMKS